MAQQLDYLDPISPNNFLHVTYAKLGVIENIEQLGHVIGHSDNEFGRITSLAGYRI